MTPDPERLVFLADDDPAICSLVGRWLEAAGYIVAAFASGEACFDALFEDTPVAVLLDLDLPGQTGLEILDLIRSHHPALPVIMLTGDDSVESVVRAMRLGAFDYLTKPLDRTRLATTVHNAEEHFRLSARVSQLERLAAGGYPGIIGESPAMRRVFAQMDRLVRSDVTVLIHGESGSGKELIARALHQTGVRSGGPFVAVNSAAIPEALVESELFGHERGAFTGALDRRIGRFEQGHRGTVFLDEIAELSPAAQARILRAIQERTFTRVGGSQNVRSDFRLISATHRDLAAEVAGGRFREDLYFRLAVFELEIPALRSRVEDIPPLAMHFVRHYDPARPGLRFSPDALRALCAWSWPGNVRELQNTVQRALLLADGEEIHLRDLPDRIRAAVPAAPIPVSAADQPAPDEGTLDAASKLLVQQALMRCGGNASAAMRELNIGRARFYRMIRRFGLEPMLLDLRQGAQSPDPVKPQEK